jgi:hypothetical protein
MWTVDGVTLKCWCLFTNPYGVKYQKTVIVAQHRPQWEPQVSYNIKISNYNFVNMSVFPDQRPVIYYMPASFCALLSWIQKANLIFVRSSYPYLSRIHFTECTKRKHATGLVRTLCTIVMALNKLSPLSPRDTSARSHVYRCQVSVLLNNKYGYFFRRLASCKMKLDESC